MATETLADIDLEPSWEDVTATHGGTASADVLLQNVGSGLVAVVSGGGSAPNGKTGVQLAPLDSVQVNAANVWVRALESSGKLSVNLL